MLGIFHSMAASRSTRVTRSTVGINGLDENFCGRTLRNRSIAHPEDVPPHSLLRSKSPKKRPESIQPQKSGNGGKSADLKLQSVRESWINPKKRGLSTSEKDNAEKEIAENCEKKQTEAASPVLKRSKRLRSEAVNCSEEDSPVKNEKEERKSLLLDKDANSPGTKQTHQCPLLDDSDKREIKRVNACEVVVNNSLDEESNYQTANGVDEKNSSALNCVDCEPAGNIKQNSTSAGSCVPKEQTAENGDLFALSSLLLSNSKEYTDSDHNVPCTNSQEQGKLEDHKLVNDCMANDHAYQAGEPATASCAEVHSSVRDFEEEVDVVGDSSASKEKCAENTPSNLNPDNDSTAISGEREPEPSSGLECTSAQMTSLSEPQENRYTLRTSPRRAACTKGSPYKCNSPCLENGPDEENNLNSFDKNVATIIDDSGSPMDSEEVDQTEKCVSEGCTADGVTKPPSEARLITGYVPSAKECASLQTTEEEEEDPDVYYFESDHVALKHNKDYQRLLQTIAVLEAQRTQSVQDLECLDKCQRESLKDPIGFVENLQKKVDLGLPCLQRVVQLPEIVWDQYTTSLGNFEREFKNRKRNTRRVKLIFDKVGLPVRPKSPLEPKKDSEPQFYSMLPLSDCPETSTSSRTQMIRGRLCDETKPGSFNQLWTVEEQKKLEQLLLKYPPEEVESRRWQKIADGLGNRTAKQVASRVQKYFIKLTKAGIPVPGRTPNLYMYSKKSSSRRQHPLNKHLFKPSTFMTSHEPPVYMDEDDDRPTFYNKDMDAAAEGEASDEESIPHAYRELAEYKELLKLKKLKKQKLQQIHMESSFVQHVGFKCDNCGAEPIQGIRWHCQDCPPQMAMDFCDSCSDCLYETETHKEDHHLEPVYRADTFLDRDYCMTQGTSYNYLDPNYFPANR